MVYKVNKYDITSIALLYKYLQDGTTVVHEIDIHQYMKMIEDEFRYIHYKSNNKITFEHLDNINKEELKKRGITATKELFFDLYGIEDLNLLIQNYSACPEELTDVSLYDSNLVTIGVKRENLKIDTESQKIRGRTHINKLSASDAIKWTNSYLYDCGCSNLKISSFFEEGHAFGGFNTRYEANKKFEKVNVKVLSNKENK